MHRFELFCEFEQGNVFQMLNAFKNEYVALSVKFTKVLSLSGIILHNKEKKAESSY